MPSAVHDFVRDLNVYGLFYNLRFVRLNSVEAVRESEYLSKIASLECKISDLLRTQNQLEDKLESQKHKSSEIDFKVRIETLERSERALLRKIEILQQSDSRGNNSQVLFDYVFKHITCLS